MATWKPAANGNYEAGRGGKKISRITFHHIVGDALAAISRFQTSGVQVSATYVIGSNGTVYQCVKESDTSYCDGNYASNQITISIEHAGGIAGVPYTDAMYAASTALVTDLIKRYGITDFKRHRDVIDKSRYPGGTACPGTLDVERIVNAAKQGDEMVPDANHLNALFRRFRGRQASQEEVDRYVSKVEYSPMVESLDTGPEADATANALSVGQTAVRDNWQGQIESLQSQLKAAGNPEVNALGNALLKLLNALGYKKG